MPCCFDPRSIRRRQDRSMECVALLRRGLALEGVTVGYNALEGIVAIAAGLVAGSVALTGFGIDSVIEVTSGVVLWWRLRAELGWWWADPVAALGDDSSRSGSERGAGLVVGRSGSGPC